VIAVRAPALAFVALLLGCRAGGPSGDLPDASESPQAKAEPAPLENVAPIPTSSALPLAPDAGPPPVPLRADEAISPDSVPRDAVAWEMDAMLRTYDVPPAFRGPETSIVAIDLAKKKTEPRLVIELSSSRARIVLASGGFVLPVDTELRARLDRYGHFVLLPGARQYRIAAPGSLRALFGERRIDVAPLIPASVTERGEGGRRLGYRTRRVEVVNRVAQATFELARVSDVGEGAGLLCRLLLDLMNAPPSTPVCTPDDVPLHVEWKWVAKGGLVFETSSLVRRGDLAPALFAAPPSSASFALPALPELGAQVLVEPAELGAFRTGPADIPGLAPDGGSPGPGLGLANASDLLRFAWVDGAPVAWVAPGGHLSLPSLDRGRYGFAWRTFLGDAFDAPTTINVPGAMVAGAGDAGSL
jgi:hypothetical protein